MTRHSAVWFDRDEANAVLEALGGGRYDLRPETKLALEQIAGGGYLPSPARVQIAELRVGDRISVVREKRPQEKIFGEVVNVGDPPIQWAAIRADFRESSSGSRTFLVNTRGHDILERA